MKSKPLFPALCDHAQRLARLLNISEELPDDPALIDPSVRSNKYVLIIIILEIFPSNPVLHFLM